MQFDHLRRGSFSGHETFPFRYAWLPKAIDLLSSDSKGFRRDDALVTLGVGKNMVKSMRHWVLACGLAQEADSRGNSLEPTELATRLFGRRGWDPYLEDPGTLWLLHWELATRPERATTWYWLFSHLPQHRFTKDDLAHWLSRLIEEKQWSRITPASLKRDIDVCIRTYVPPKTSKTVQMEDTVDCPLVELGLLSELPGKGGFVLRRGEHASLPDSVFAFAVVSHLLRTRPGTNTVAIDAVAVEPGSPGRVFCLGEDAVLDRLDRLDALTGGSVRFDETAGLRQLLIRELPDPLELLAEYFEAHNA